eukprot:scaffold43741_cov31-Phaeocystis_antarctica.AAC.1
MASPNPVPTARTSTSRQMTSGTTSRCPLTPLAVRHPGPTRQWRPPAAHLGIRVVYPVLRLVDIIGQHRVVSLPTSLPASFQPERG